MALDARLGAARCGARVAAVERAGAPGALRLGISLATGAAGARLAALMCAASLASVRPSAAAEMGGGARGGTRPDGVAAVPVLVAVAPGGSGGIFFAKCSDEYGLTCVAAVAAAVEMFGRATGSALFASTAIVGAAMATGAAYVPGGGGCRRA